jgi:phosphotransferase system  glucose/maltose/N-acetylglucosamine-specific IIC component
MLHRIIGGAIGGLITYLLLVILIGSQYSDKYLPAIVIGVLVALLWPWFIGFMLARRVKQRRDAQIQAEVERQVAEKS